MVFPDGCPNIDRWARGLQGGGASSLFHCVLVLLHAKREGMGSRKHVKMRTAWKAPKLLHSQCAPESRYSDKVKEPVLAHQGP